MHRQRLKMICSLCNLMGTLLNTSSRQGGDCWCFRESGESKTLHKMNQDGHIPVANTESALMGVQVKTSRRQTLKSRRFPAPKDDSTLLLLRETPYRRWLLIFRVLSRIRSRLDLVWNGTKVDSAYCACNGSFVFLSRAL